MWQPTNTQGQATQVAKRERDVTATDTSQRRRTTGALDVLLPVPAIIIGTIALATLPLSTSGRGGTRSWWRRGDNLRADAQAAKDAAAQAFYELDSAQRDVRISVETISAVDQSPTAQQAVATFTEISRKVDEASHGYIVAIDACDLEAEELDSAAASRARRELGKAREELERVKAELERFAETLTPLLGQAETQLARLIPAVDQAKAALLGASNALDAVRAAGLRADDLAARLAALGPELTKLNQGAGTHGVRATLQRADEVLTAATQVRKEAEELPERAREIDRRLASLRTRSEALAHRADSVDPVLSELRRRFSAACWQDLQQVPHQARSAAEQAGVKLREVAQARTEQRWPDALSRLSTVRALLTTADEGISAAFERLESLNEAAHNPTAEIDRTRFALRDAQRLAMAGRSTPDPKHARPLDDAVARIDRAVQDLDGRHPDYWHFLTEMAAVRETVGRVVANIREERAGGQ